MVNYNFKKRTPPIGYPNRVWKVYANNKPVVVTSKNLLGQVRIDPIFITSEERQDYLKNKR